MATIGAYAKFADAVYERDRAWAIGGWACQKWENGTWYGNGFQGGIFANRREIIVACKGTSPTTQTAVADVSADLRLALGVLPNQAGSAYRMAKAAVQIANGRPVTITGHSLGGALSQVVGTWCNIPFVTFNAPPMKAQVKLSTFNFLKPLQMARSLSSPSTGAIYGGWNFRVKGDLISWAAVDQHIGVLVELNSPGSGGNHLIKTCVDALSQTDWFEMEAFAG